MYEYDYRTNTFQRDSESESSQRSTIEMQIYSNLNMHTPLSLSEL